MARTDSEKDSTISICNSCACMYSNCHLSVEWDSIGFEQWEGKDSIHRHARHCFTPLAMMSLCRIEAKCKVCVGEWQTPASERPTSRDLLIIFPSFLFFLLAPYLAPFKPPRQQKSLQARRPTRPNPNPSRPHFSVLLSILSSPLLASLSNNSCRHNAATTRHSYALVFMTF